MQVNPKKTVNSFDTRRSFLKSSSSGLAATAALAATTLPKVHAAGDSIIKVGLVGCGGRGSGAAVNSMEADPNVRIVALGDLSDKAISNCRRSLARNYKTQMQVTDEQCFTGIDNYKQVLASDIDVILLAAPPHYRPEHFAASVDAGKHIFCEKPVATDAAGVRRIVESCKQAEGKQLNVVSGLCWRYHTGMQEIIARIHDGQIGEVVASQANYLTSPVWMKTREPGESEMQYQMRNWYNYIWLSGDHIVEQFIHSIDKALWLHNDVPPVRAIGMGGRQLRSDETQGNIYDHFAVVYEWADGTKTFANTRQMENCFVQVEDFVSGTDGTARLCEGVIEGKNKWMHSGDVVQMHQAEQNEMFRAIRGERERINNGDYMCKSTLMSILGREACYTGASLTYEEVANSTQDFRPASYDGGEAPQVIVPQPGAYRFA